MPARWSCVAPWRTVCLVVMDGMAERAPEARRGIQVCQDLQGKQESLDHLAQLGPSGTMALLENLDQRETLDHVDLQDLQVCLVQLEERVPQGYRGM